MLYLLIGLIISVTHYREPTLSGPVLANSDVACNQPDLSLAQFGGGDKHSTHIKRRTQLFAIVNKYYK